MTTVAAPGTAAPRSEPSYDDSKWPIFAITMPPTTLPMPAFMAHLDRCSAAFTRGTPFCMLIDLDRHPPMPAHQRKLVAERMQLDDERYPKLMLATAIIVPSAFARGVVTAINWLARPRHPLEPYATRAEATAWLLKVLASARGAG